MTRGRRYGAGWTIAAAWLVIALVVGLYVVVRHG